MATNIDDIVAKVDSRLLQAKSGLTTAEKRDAVSAAREEYEKVRPLEKAVAFAGDGGFDYAVSTKLPSYVDGFSILRAVYYPYVTTESLPPLLDKTRYQIVLLPTGLKLRFFADVPTASEQVMVQHTAQHALTTGASTIPVSDDEALADLGACYAFLALASRASQENDSTIAADSVDRLSKAAEHRANAGRMRSAYENKMGKSSELSSAVVVTAIPQQTSGRDSGRRTLFH